MYGLLHLIRLENIMLQLTQLCLCRYCYLSFPGSFVIFRFVLQCSKRHVWNIRSTTLHPKLLHLVRAVDNSDKKRIRSSRETRINTENHQKSRPIAGSNSIHPVEVSEDPASDIPEGSLRHVYPPPRFIPLVSGDLSP